MLRDWTQWRMRVNSLMADEITNDGVKPAKRDDTLTSPKYKKTPFFFKGIHGQRIKDVYGGEVINEDDDEKAKLEKNIIDENFYLFGIPRISMRRSSIESENRQASSMRNYNPNRRRASTSLVDELFNGTRGGRLLSDGNTSYGSRSLSRQTSSASLFEDTIVEDEQFRLSAENEGRRRRGSNFKLYIERANETPDNRRFLSSPDDERYHFPSNFNGSRRRVSTGNAKYMF